MADQLTPAEGLAFDLEAYAKAIAAARLRAGKAQAVKRERSKEHEAYLLILEAEGRLQAACHLLAPDCHCPSAVQIAQGHVLANDDGSSLCPACVEMGRKSR